MKYAICRVVGNELPPRDPPGAKIQALKHVLEYENITDPETKRVWVMNHIIDPNYEKELRSILQGETIVDEPFDYYHHASLPTWYEKVAYSIHLNGGRNVGLKYCMPQFLFTVVFDQDCYIYPNEWQQIKNNIEQDQKFNDRKYYLLSTKRLTAPTIPKTLEGLPHEEPMIVFRNDAPQIFNPHIRFGDDNKRKFLAETLGVQVSIKNHTVDFLNDTTIFVGNCAHIAFGNDELERDVELRRISRQESIERFLETIEIKYNMVF